jgi:hypothetical protein
MSSLKKEEIDVLKQQYIDSFVKTGKSPEAGMKDRYETERPLIIMASMGNFEHRHSTLFSHSVAPQSAEKEQKPTPRGPK